MKSEFRGVEEGGEARGSHSVIAEAWRPLSAAPCRRPATTITTQQQRTTGSDALAAADNATSLSSGLQLRPGGGGGGAVPASTWASEPLTLDMELRYGATTFMAAEPAPSQPLSYGLPSSLRGGPGCWGSGCGSGGGYGGALPRGSAAAVRLAEAASGQQAEALNNGGLGLPPLDSPRGFAFSYGGSGSGGVPFLPAMPTFEDGGGATGEAWERVARQQEQQEQEAQARKAAAEASDAEDEEMIATAEQQPAPGLTSTDAPPPLPTRMPAPPLPPHALPPPGYFPPPPPGWPFMPPLPPGVAPPPPGQPPGAAPVPLPPFSFPFPPFSMMLPPPPGCPPIPFFHPAFPPPPLASSAPTPPDPAVCDASADHVAHGGSPASSSPFEQVSMLRGSFCTVPGAASVPLLPCCSLFSTIFCFTLSPVSRPPNVPLAVTTAATRQAAARSSASGDGSRRRHSRRVRPWAWRQCRRWPPRSPLRPDSARRCPVMRASWRK